MNSLSLTKHALIITAITAAAFVGCGKKDSVDTSKLEQSFQSAEPTAKQSIEKAVTAVKAGDYSGAMASLQKAAAKARLTPEQEQAIKDVMEQIGQQMKQVANKAVEGAQKSLGDLQKSLKQ